MIAIRYEVFYEVASNLSFSKAAEILYISQPAISKHVKKLEAELGIPLFVRGGNTISLTSSGKKLLEYLHEVKVIQRNINSDMKLVKNQFSMSGELRIGASTTISLYVMPKVLSSFRKKFPLVKLLLVNRNSENVINALLNKEIDMAIVEAHHQVNSIHSQYFMQDEIIPVTATNSRHAKGSITLQELKSMPIALRERGSGTLSVLMKELENHGIKPGELNITARLGGTEALKNFLIQDDSIGFLSRLAVHKELKEGLLREITINSFAVSRRFNFVLRQGEESMGLVRSFIKESKLLYNF